MTVIKGYLIENLFEIKRNLIELLIRYDKREDKEAPKIPINGVNSDNNKIEIINWDKPKNIELTW
jgi:hypothetical protein